MTIRMAAILALAAVSGAWAQGTVAGKAAEVMDSGGYTYVRVESGSKSTWVAVPQMKLAKGEPVAFQDGMEMRDFKSKTLNRTFKSIIFSQGPAGKSSAKPPLEHGGAPKLAKDSDVKTAKATGPDAYTVEELYSRKSPGPGKRASVRGKVVKVSRQIMGLNWVHLQDGTGDAKAGTHDLTVTTGEDANVGETLTASGTVVKDKDFGAGYKYAVLLEKTTLSR